MHEASQYIKKLWPNLTEAFKYTRIGVLEERARIGIPRQGL